MKFKDRLPVLNLSMEAFSLSGTGTSKRKDAKKSAE